MDTFSDHAERISQGSTTLDRHAPREMFATPIQAVAYDGRFVQLTLVPTSAQQRSYVVPGQYVVARFADGQPRFVALYGEPGARTWEFLFEPKAEWDLSQFAPGSAVSVSLAEGRGYPTRFEAIDGVTVFVSGSGIASILPWLQARPEVDSIRVVYALSDQAPETVARASNVVEQLNADFRVVDPSAMTDAAMLQPETIEKQAVLLCGSPRMMRDVAEVLLARGVDPAQIYTNLS